MKKIFVVDDEKTIVDFLRTVIEASGHACVSAGSGEEAYGRIQEENPDLVFADVMLPELDGITLCSKLKSNPKTREIPVVVETALTDATSIQSAYDNGADDYMPKPFDREAVLRKIVKFLGAQADHPEAIHN